MSVGFAAVTVLVVWGCWQSDLVPLHARQSLCLPLSSIPAPQLASLGNDLPAYFFFPPGALGAQHLASPHMAHGISQETLSPSRQRAH